MWVGVRPPAVAHQGADEGGETETGGNSDYLLYETRHLDTSYQWRGTEDLILYLGFGRVEASYKKDHASLRGYRWGGQAWFETTLI